MRVVKFNKNMHFASLIANLVNRKAYIPQITELPKIGYAAFDGKVMVAAAFLRRMEGGYAQIDGLTSNPYESADARHRGIDLVVSRLLKHAKELHISHVTFTSEDEGTILRSQKYGFKKLPLSILAADLNN